MNVLSRAYRAITASLKAAAMTFSGSASRWSMLLLGTRRDYARLVGDSTKSSAVIACVNWIARTFPEAPLQVERRRRDGSREVVVNHPMVELLEVPNPFYSGTLLWMATILDFTTTGNAYWVKVRNGVGRPLQLWWVPSWQIEPRWPADGSAFISHYEYRPDGKLIHLPVEDVVHFRYGLDPHNPRKGLSPLASVLREIFTDEEAANFSASLLANLGIPGVVIAPEADDVDLSPEDADTIKADYQQKFGGDHRGEPMVLSARVKVTPLSFSPQQMDLKSLRRLPEERVSAVLGVPAIVAGLGAGLDRSTFANYAEAREAAYESNIIPTQRLFAAELRAQLLPDFGDPRGLEVGFDLSRVRVLQEDQNKLWARYDLGVRGGWVKVSTAKQALGLPVEPGDDVYLRPLSVIAVGPEADAFAPPELGPAPAGDDGDGQQGEGDGNVNPGNSEQDQGDGSQHNRRNQRRAETRVLRSGRTKAAAFEQRVVTRLGRERDQLARPFAADVERAFEQLADAVLAAIREQSKSLVHANGRKQNEEPPAEWPAILRFILQDERRLDLLIPPDIGKRYFRPVYERQWALIGETVFGAVSEHLGVTVAWNLSDPVALDLVLRGGERITQLDAEGQTRQAIMQALRDGLEAGEGAEPLARRIRGYVEGRHMYPGVYQRAYDAARARGFGDEAAQRAGDRAARQYRAETIARTEVATAVNLSSIAAYRVSDVVEALRVFDGDGCGWRSHDDPDRADGKTVSFDEAEQFPLAHPRCLRNFAPIVREG